MATDDDYINTFTELRQMFKKPLTPEDDARIQAYSNAADQLVELWRIGLLSDLLYTTFGNLLEVAMWRLCSVEKIQAVHAKILGVEVVEL